MRTELLAPAGSLAGLKAVINAGADAVYVGGSLFGARAYAENPDEEEMLRGIEFAHLRGAKVYLTVNTLLKEREMERLYDFILPYYRQGVDAVLVQDFGVLKFLHQHFPDLPLHASTQMTLTGPKGASLVREYGITRVVPARELSLKELKRIKEETGLEVECFIHGALCVCYSGQCLYSSMLGGRSGNRGRCAQPCRLLYLMDDKTGFDGKTSILDKKESRHFISPKDLSGIDAIRDLVSAGIDSLKIEGRMKRPEYAAGVTAIYRKYLDLALSGKAYQVEKKDRQILYDLYNRTGFTDGYFRRHNGPEMMAPVKHELTNEETTARQKLYELMNEAYLKKDRQVPVEGSVRIHQHENMQLTLSCGALTISRQGDAAEAADRQPLTEEAIRSRLMKTGGTDFSFRSLNVDTDGTSFLPVRSLNEIRRAALEDLKEELIRPYRRFSEIPAQEKRHPDRAVPGTDLTVNVLVSTMEQFEEVLSSPAVSHIYLESALLGKNTPVKDAEAALHAADKAGKRLIIALPYIDRLGSEERELKTAAAALIEKGLGGFLVRSTESLSDLKSRGLSAHLISDAGLYTYNSASKEFLRDQGILKDTAPFELNARELAERDNTGSELVIYGHLPLMVTAQCLEKNTAGCTKKNRTHVLTDRLGMKFKVKCVCKFCYNIIYNSVPLSLLSETAAVAKMGFHSVRLQFTDEQAEEVRRILQRTSEAIRKGGAVYDGDYTKGHYGRGVE